MKKRLFLSVLGIGISVCFHGSLVADGLDAGRPDLIVVMADDRGVSVAENGQTVHRGQNIRPDDRHAGGAMLQ